ncbi:MAG: hypothetical protein ABR562_03665 [Thermoplasmatota archaeon]
MAIVDQAQVRDRLAKTPNLTLPPSITPALLEDYVRGASAIVLKRAGYSAPPAPGSLERDALEEACLALVVNSVRKDLFRSGDMAEQLRRERQDILREIEDIAQEASDGNPDVDYTEEV